MAYIIVFRNWIAYHYYIAILTETKAQIIRSNIVFALISLYLYFYLLESVKDFSTVVLMMPVIAGFDLITASILIFKNTKLPFRGIKSYRGIAKSIRIPLILTVILIVQAIVYNFLVGHFQSSTLAGAPLIDWYILATSFLIYLVQELVFAIATKHLHHTDDLDAKLS